MSDLASDGDDIVGPVTDEPQPAPTYVAQEFAARFFTKGDE